MTKRPTSFKHGVTLYLFYNEACSGSLKNIGCGFRTVIALKPGRKWITLVEWTTLDIATITVKEWERLKPEAMIYRRGYVLDAMRSRIPYKFPSTDDGKPGRPTQTIKQALNLVKGTA